MMMLCRAIPKLHQVLIEDECYIIFSLTSNLDVNTGNAIEAKSEIANEDQVEIPTAPPPSKDRRTSMLKWFSQRGGMK
jgi:hypothetical protein